MKTVSRKLGTKNCKFLLAFGILLLIQTVRAQLFVLGANGTIGEYTTSGIAINASLVTGINSPAAIAVSGNDIFVTQVMVNSGTGRITEYTTGGKTVASWADFWGHPAAIAVDGNDIFVASGDIVEEYTTNGQLINPSLLLLGGKSTTFSIAFSGDNLFAAGVLGEICDYTTSGQLIGAFGVGSTGLSGLAVSGDDLFVANYGNGTVGEFTTSGTVVNATLISGLNHPESLAIVGNDIFVANYGSGTVGEYTTSGAVVNASLISGLGSPVALAVLSAPEPPSIVLGGFGFLLFIFCWRVDSRARHLS